MTTLILIIHVLLAISLVGLVLIQHGKGADAGAAFGSGASGTVFGARGATTFLQKMTGWLVVAFFATSLLLAYVINTSHNPASVVDSATAPKTEPVKGQQSAPTKPLSAPADKPADVPSTSGAVEQGADTGGKQTPADVPGASK